MAKVKITGHASGTGVITVTAPNTSTDRTITLPDGDVTLGAATPSIVDGGNATAMTIDSSENVGIGTSSPAATLDVNGTAWIGIASAAPKTAELQVHKNAAGGAVLFGDESTVAISTNATGAGGQGYIGSLWFGSQDVSSATQYGWKMAGMAGYVSGDTSSSGGSADLLFYTASSSQVGTERMRITADGRGLSQFTAKAWVNFNGTGTVAIRDSHNVSSITDNSAGNYRVNFSNNMANADYAVGTSGGGSSSYTGSVKTDSTTYTRTVSYLPLLTFNVTPAGANTASINAIVFGD